MLATTLDRVHTQQAKPQQRLRVCLVSLHFAEYTLRLAQALSTRVELLVVVYSDNALSELGEDYANRFATMGVQLLVLVRPRGAQSVFANFRQLRARVQAFGPQVLHMQEDLRDELVMALPWLRACPLVLTVHDPQPHSGRDARVFRLSRHRLYRWWVRRQVDLALTHGMHLVRLLEQDWPMLRGRVQSVPHGPLGRGVQRLRSPKPDGPVRLLFFGRIHAYKGLGAFVEMVKGLHAAGLQVLGVVAGRGDDLDNHRAAMDAAGCFEIRDRYIAAAEVDALFMDAHAVILPYTDGTQSGVAALALGYACPVVASAVGAIPELVRDGVNGLLVQPADAAALYAASKALVTDAALHRRLSEGAQALAVGALSWATIADQTVRWYAHAGTATAPNAAV